MSYHQNFKAMKSSAERIDAAWIIPFYCNYFDVNPSAINNHEETDNKQLDYSGIDKRIDRGNSSVTWVAQRVRGTYRGQLADMGIRTSLPTGRETELQKMERVLNDKSLGHPQQYFLFRTQSEDIKEIPPPRPYDAYVFDFRQLANIAVHPDQYDVTTSTAPGPKGCMAIYLDCVDLAQAGAVDRYIDKNEMRRLTTVTTQQAGLGDFS